MNTAHVPLYTSMCISYMQNIWFTHVCKYVCATILLEYVIFNTLEKNAETKKRTPSPKPCSSFRVLVSGSTLLFWHKLLCFISFLHSTALSNAAVKKRNRIIAPKQLVNSGLLGIELLPHRHIHLVWVIQETCLSFSNSDYPQHWRNKMISMLRSTILLTLTRPMPLYYKLQPSTVTGGYVKDRTETKPKLQHLYLFVAP